MCDLPLRSAQKWTNSSFMHGYSFLALREFFESTRYTLEFFISLLHDFLQSRVLSKIAHADQGSGIGDGYQRPALILFNGDVTGQHDANDGIRLESIMGQWRVAGAKNDVGTEILV